jgi:hypothetical protein
MQWPKAQAPVQCADATGKDWDKMVPGDMFWMHFSAGRCYDHDPPCERHLSVVLPNGHVWVIDSRASNCDSPCKVCGVPYKDHKGPNPPHHYADSVPDHRCWQRHGDDIARQTVNKAAILHPSCGAGSGSIMSDAGGPDAWHGFLTDGVLHT